MKTFAPLTPVAPGFTRPPSAPREEPLRPADGVRGELSTSGGAWVRERRANARAAAPKRPQIVAFFEARSHRRGTMRASRAAFPVQAGGSTIAFLLSVSG